MADCGNRAKARRDCTTTYPTDRPWAAMVHAAEEAVDLSPKAICAVALPRKGVHHLGEHRRVAQNRFLLGSGWGEVAVEHEEHVAPFHDVVPGSELDAARAAQRVVLEEGIPEHVRAQGRIHP